MNGASYWAIKPCRIGDWIFPGLVAPQNPNNAPHWEDLTDEIGRHLAQLHIRASRRQLAAAVRDAANRANHAAIESLLTLADDLEKP